MVLERRLLLPPHLLRPALALIVPCLIIVGALGAEVAGNTDAGPVDQAAFEVFWLRRDIVTPLTVSTNPAAMIGLITLIVSIALWHRRPRIALLAVLGPVVAAGLNTWALKPFFDRTHDGYLAYPSGHTTTLVSILAVITLVVAGNAAPALRWKATLGVAATALTLVGVGAWAIIGARYHYLSDTLGSLFWGVAVVIIVAAAIDAVAKPVGDPLLVRPNSGNTGR
ncbi:phosphatase PAP2 family protein [Actinokineospora sp. HUAS TT18]|uniref:phosphatase PAP2 family protein n=1 Tax=Actinokineospora sp. HUAS TT18 TaxID=3447451 RepID=UPI003F51D875